MKTDTYKIYKGFDGKSYVRVYFMDFIELGDFKAGREIYVSGKYASIVSMEEIGEIQVPPAALL